MIRLLTDTGLKVQVASAAFSGLAALLTLIALARLLGPSGYATYGVVAAAAALALVIQDGGHRVRLQRDLMDRGLSEADRQRLVGEAIGWSTAATVALTLATLSIGFFLGWEAALLLALLVVGNLGKAGNGFASSALRARGLFRAEGRLQFHRHALVAIITIAAVLAFPSILVACLAACLAQLLLLLLPAERQELASLRPGRPEIWLMSISVLTALYLRVDLLVLGHVLGPVPATGTYAALSRLIDMYVFALTPVATMFFFWIRRNPERFAPRQIAGLCCTLAAPALLLLLVALFKGEELVTLPLGAGYAEGARFLPWLAAAMVLLPFNFLLSQMLLADDREKALTAIIAGATLVKAVVVWQGAAEHGPVVGGVAVLMAEAFILVACISVLWTHRSRGGK